MTIPLGSLEEQGWQASGSMLLGITGSGCVLALSVASGQEVHWGPAAGWQDRVAGNWASLQLTQRLGHSLQEADQPGQEVRLWLGLCKVQRPETGQVQGCLAPPAPAAYARSCR